jgi:HlyD family secretion protein
MKAEAQLNLEQVEFSRAEDLLERGMVSEAEHQDASAQLASARASVLSAEAALDRAKTNLDYAVITSPISGTVIERSVEPGQTVAASLSAPVLFIIAEDLSDMEIHVLVDESDIGRVKVGQEVRFTVDAYYDEEFWGEVRQIRLLPQTVSNVVNYTVVVDAANERGLLLPGMTATADFLIEHRTDVLLAPNAALKLSPTMAMWGALLENMQGRRPSGAAGDASPGDTEAAAPGGQGAGGQANLDIARSDAGAGSAPGVQGRDAGAQGREATGSASSAMAGAAGGSPMDAMMTAAGIDPANGGVLWYLDENGKLAIVPVEKGATDGSKTEIVRGRNVRDGMQVITVVTEAAEDDGGSRNPLAAGPFGRRRR